MNLIYHITTHQAAQAAAQSGEYRAASLASDGFIHFSQRHQVLGVANAFYAGQKDLVILMVDPARLTAQLKYEPPVHPGSQMGESVPSEDQLFPHLYGPLNFEAVLGVVEFPLTAGGVFSLPEPLP